MNSPLWNCLNWKCHQSYQVFNETTLQYINISEVQNATSVTPFCWNNQPSNPRRHPTCWASSQRSHTISRTPCHGAWTPAPLSAHPSIGCGCTAPQIKTPICTRRTTTHQLLWQQQQQQHTVRAAQWADHRWNTEWANNPTRLRTSIPHTGTHTPGMTLPRRAWVRLNRLRPGVGRFRSYLYKWGMDSSAACECGAEQTVEQVILHCPIHLPPMDYKA